MPETIPINEVPKDINPLATGVVKNPFKTKKFSHKFDGELITLPAGGSVVLPLPAAVHIAKHIAEKIVRTEHRKKIALIKDVEKRYQEGRKSIPRYKQRMFKLMKEIVETDDPFFDTKGAEVKATKSKR